MKKPVTIILICLAVGISVYYGVNEFFMSSTKDNSEDTSTTGSTNSSGLDNTVGTISNGNDNLPVNKDVDSDLIKEAVKMAEFSCKINNLVASEKDPAKLEDLRKKSNDKIAEMKNKFPTNEEFTEFSRAVQKLIARDCVIVKNSKPIDDKEIPVTVVAPKKVNKSVTVPSKVLIKKAPLTRAQLIQREETKKLVSKRKREQIMRQRSGR